FLARGLTVFHGPVRMSEKARSSGGVGERFERQLDREACALGAVDGKAPAEGLNALAHSAQAVAFLAQAAASVVLYNEGGFAVAGDEAHFAAGGLGVTDDIGDGFAEGEGENGFFTRAERGRVFFAEEGNAGGIEDVTRALDFSGQAFGAVSGNGFADFAEGFAG